ISRTMIHTVAGILELRIGATTIGCTPEHPFWVPGTGWCRAGDLEPGTSLLTQTGALVSLDRVERRAGSVTGFNLEVDGFHTYYVSDVGILVHNKAAPGRLGGQIPVWRGKLRAWRDRLANRPGTKFDPLRAEADDLATKVDQLDRQFTKAEQTGNE